MAQYITKIRTESGDLQIDYNALANLPTTDTTLTTANKAADAQATGEQITLLDDAISRLDEEKASSLSDLGITVTADEINYIDGVTSNIQTQFNELNTEIGEIDSTTSNIQTQLNELDADKISIITSKLLEGGLDATIKNGWYGFTYSQVGPQLSVYSDYDYACLRVDGYDEQNVMQTVYFFKSGVNTYVIQRSMVAGIWQEWEWQNPPMENNPANPIGVEYATTERYRGKRIYVQNIYLGSLPNTGSKEFSNILPSACTDVISIEGYCYSRVSAEDSSTGFVLPMITEETASKFWIDVTIGKIGITTKVDASQYEGYVFVKYVKE